MTPSKLFVKRLLAELKFRFNIWKIVVDWTVALYIVIPLLFVGGRQYLLLWKNPPAFLNLLPVELLFLLCYLLAWSGSMRVFLREGDQLFLISQERWVKSIIAYGLSYSFGLGLLQTMFFLSLLAPIIFQHYNFTQSQVLALFLIVFLLKITLGLGRQLLTLRFSGWRQFVTIKSIMALAGLLFIILIPYLITNLSYTLLTDIFLIIFIAFLTVKRLNYQGSFFADIARISLYFHQFCRLILGGKL